jgi:hypothetical protein
MVAIANCNADRHSLKQRKNRDLVLDDGKYKTTVRCVHHKHHLPGKMDIATETM